jgi:RNase H-fold protein (predicted Holliday junction resolvase)
VFIIDYSIKKSDLSPYLKDHPFYLEELDPEKKKIFIIGSSTIARVNATFLNEQINEKNNDYLIYNLAISADDPIRRSSIIHPTVSLNPKLIVYGVSMIDFRSSYVDQLLPDPKLIDNKFFDFFGLNFVPLNPKLNSEKIIQSILENVNLDEKSKPNNKILTISHTPFYKYPKQYAQITNFEEIKKDISKEDLEIYKIHSLSNNDQLNKFKKIIEYTQKEKIEMIIVAVPLSKPLLDSLSDEDRKLFDEILEEISQKYNIKIFDLTEKYSELNIWQDSNHVALNTKSIIFSEDLLKIIYSAIET